ncbi:MAG: ABC transporter substrate-binding protein [Hyphomicrobiales bacterium]
MTAPAVLRRAYAADTFKIGKIGPVTGPIAGFGEATAWVVDGLKDQMAKLPVPVEIIQKDSQSNPNRAAEVATELIEKDGVKLLLAKGTPDTTNPVADQAELNGVPCITDDAPRSPTSWPRRPRQGLQVDLSLLLGPGRRDRQLPVDLGFLGRGKGGGRPLPQRLRRQCLG